MKLIIIFGLLTIVAGGLLVWFTSEFQNVKIDQNIVSLFVIIAVCVVGVCYMVFKFFKGSGGGGE